MVIKKPLGADSIKRCHLTCIGNHIVEIRRSYDRLISTIGFPILVRWHIFYWIRALISKWHLMLNKQRVLMHGHQGWNVRHGLCHICMIYVYVWVVYSFCLFCCLFIIVTTQFVALYKPCKPKPKPSTYDPPDNHPLAEIQRPILRPEPKQQICHQHANTDHFGK